MFLGAGARAEAMGGAFTAIAGDPTAASSNPAGLAELSHPELSLSYDRLTVAVKGSPFTVAGETSSGLAFAQTLETRSRGDYSHVGFAAVTLPVKRLVTQLTYRKLSTFPELDTAISGRRRLGDAQGNITDVSYSSQAALLPAGDMTTTQSLWPGEWDG